MNKSHLETLYSLLADLPLQPVLDAIEEGKFTAKQYQDATDALAEAVDNDPICDMDDFE